MDPLPMPTAWSVASSTTFFAGATVSSFGQFQRLSIVHASSSIMQDNMCTYDVLY